MKKDMTLNRYANFAGKLTLGFKNEIRNLANFNANNDKSEYLHTDVILLLKVYYI